MALGPELWDDTPSLQSDWTDNGGNNYSYVGDGSFNRMGEENIVVIGKTYTIDFDVSGYSGAGEMSVQRIGGAILLFSTNGFKTVTYEAPAVQIRFARQSGTVSCTIANVSVKEVITGRVMGSLANKGGLAGYGGLAGPGGGIAG